MTKKDVARRRSWLTSRRANLTPEQQALFAQQLAQTYPLQGVNTDDNRKGTSAQVLHPVWGTLYKTKELVRRLPDGKIEFLGAADASVMARGRILEPGLVESVLAQHPAVYEAVVLVRQKASQNHPSPADDPYLIAYVVLIDRDAKRVLRVFLKERLPSYLIPAVVCLDRLPLTMDGRVDQQALPAPDQDEGMLERNRTNPLQKRIAVEVSLKRNDLQERHAKLSAVKRALLAKKLQKNQQ